MTLRFLTKAASGIQQLVNAITASTGATDANKIVGTNSEGKLDASFLPTSIGKAIVTATAGEALSAGAMVSFTASGVVLADNTDTAKIAQGFVLEAVASGGSATVYTSGVNSALTGLIPGAVYFLGTNGTVTTTAPVFAVGTVCQSLGYAQSATELVYDFAEPVEFANQ